MSEDSITLKWGSLKAWHLETEPAREAMQRYLDAGQHSASAMLQKDTKEQKELLCQVIDSCDLDEVLLDWDDKMVSKDEAKEYIMEYGRE
jgi:hypothetical protein